MDSPAPALSATDDSSFQHVAPGFDFRGLLHQLISKSWVIVLCLALALALGFSYLARTPKLFMSRAVMEVDVSGENIAPVQTTRPESYQSLEQLRTIEQNLRNRSLMERVVRAADLVHTPGFLPPREGGALYSPEACAGALSNMVSATVRRGTRLIDVFVTHTDPAIAQKIADAIGTEYIRQSIEKHRDGAMLAFNFLSEQAETLRGKVDDDEHKLQAFREKTGTTDVGERGNGAESKLRDLTARLTQAKADRLRMDNDFKTIAKFKNDPDQLLTIPTIANNPGIMEIKTQIAIVNGQIAALAQRYKDEHPRMIQARSQLDAFKKNLREAVLRLPPLLQTEYENSASNAANLEKAVADQEKAALAVNATNIPFTELQRALEADNTLYQAVLKRRSETDFTKGIQADPVHVSEGATFSNFPISPKPFETLMLCSLGGLLLGVGIIVLITLLDRTVKTVDQAEHYLNLPVLAAVPDMKFPAQKSYLLMIKDPNATASESFRTLRASLALLGPENERKVLLFTSAVPSEGKSFSSTNYAVSLAQQGHRTLLIDADLRRPSIHKVFELARTQLGVTDYLVGKADMKTATVTCEIDNLHIMPGGSKAPNPAELLSSHTFGELVAEATRQFDRVVIDSAPVLAVSDTLIITPYVQSLCLVIRSNHTKRNAVQRAVGLLEHAGNRPVGLVLNRLPRSAGVGHYYYYTQHGYGDGVYGAPVEVSRKG